MRKYWQLHQGVRRRSLNILVLNVIKIYSNPVARILKKTMAVNSSKPLWPCSISTVSSCKLLYCSISLWLQQPSDDDSGRPYLLKRYKFMRLFFSPSFFSLCYVRWKGNFFLFVRWGRMKVNVTWRCSRTPAAFETLRANGRAFIITNESLRLCLDNSREEGKLIYQTHVLCKSQSITSLGTQS